MAETSTQNSQTLEEEENVISLDHTFSSTYYHEDNYLSSMPTRWLSGTLVCCFWILLCIGCLIWNLVICVNHFCWLSTGHIKNIPTPNELNRFARPALDTILGSLTKLNYANIERRQLLENHVLYILLSSKEVIIELLFSNPCIYTCSMQVQIKIPLQLTEISILCCKKKILYW